MAEVAAFPDVDVAAGQFQGRVGAHALDLFDRALQPEQLCDLDEAANRDDQEDADDEQQRMPLELGVLLPDGHQRPQAIALAGTAEASAGAAEGEAIVFHMLTIMIRAPLRYMRPPTVRMTFSMCLAETVSMKL